MPGATRLKLSLNENQLTAYVVDDVARFFSENRVSDCQVAHGYSRHVTFAVSVSVFEQLPIEIAPGFAAA